jgi:hypothetical protein
MHARVAPRQVNETIAPGADHAADPVPHPCLWFDGQAEEAAKFYSSIFPHAKIDRPVPSLE